MDLSKKFESSKKEKPNDNSIQPFCTSSPNHLKCQSCFVARPDSSQSSYAKSRVILFDIPGFYDGLKKICQFNDANPNLENTPELPLE